MDKLAVFISSTIGELAEEREAVASAIRRMKCNPLRVEEHPEWPESPLQVCEKLVQQADIYLGILGREWGSEIPGEGISITEWEFGQAQAAGKRSFLQRMSTYTCSRARRRRNRTS